MSIEELPDDFDAAMSQLMPPLPPDMADTKRQTVDEVVRDLKRSPFFMTSLDDAEGDEPNPELEAIKSLIYEGARSEVAENFREQGNEHARDKEWKDAKEFYSKGLTALRTARKAEDPSGAEEDAKEAQTKELLLVNRALCHLEIQNFRSCILDCSACLELNPSNVKAHYRMASALFRLVKLSEAQSTTQAGLLLDPSNKALETLLDKINSKQAERDKVEAKKRAIAESQLKEKYALSQALKKRGIKYRTSTDRPALALPDDATMHLEGDKFSADSTLTFPVMVLYPLHMQSDFIKAFQESQTLAQHLEYLLPPPWDERAAYKPEGVDAYMETVAGGIVKWGRNVDLGALLGGGKVEVLDGIVRVNLVPKARSGEWIESLRKKKKKSENT